MVLVRYMIQEGGSYKSSPRNCFPCKYLYLFSYVISTKHPHFFIFPFLNCLCAWCLVFQAHLLYILREMLCFTMYPNSAIISFISSAIDISQP